MNFSYIGRLVFTSKNSMQEAEGFTVRVNFASGGDGDLGLIVSIIPHRTKCYTRGAQVIIMKALVYQKARL